MTRDEQDLARRLAAHPKWRWMRGMVVTTTRTEDGLDVIDHIGEDGVAWFGDGDSCSFPYCTPDLDDPATQGCLIAMLGDRLVSMHRRCARDGGELWRVIVVAPDGRNQTAIGAALGEALARALLDAWGEA